MTPEVDQAWNAVAYAAIAYRREQFHLACALTDARRHGLDTDDMVTASGMDEAAVADLLNDNWGWA